MLCSECDKESDTLVKCRACKCVYYCDKDCQNKHWKVHKKECRRIKKKLDERGGKLDLGTELDVGPLGKMPSREECPICMLVLPINENLHVYAACCGKVLCAGCNFQDHVQTEKRADTGQTPMTRTCAFCRSAMPKDEEEILAQMRKRVELKDPNAIRNMGLDFESGAMDFQWIRTSALISFANLLTLATYLL